MSLVQGSMSLRRFLVLGPVPGDEALLEGLQQGMFRSFQDGLEEERAGWCDWRNLLITPPDGDWVRQDRFALFSLRMDSRKVPASLLRAHVEQRIQQLAQEKNLAFVSKETRTSIADEVKAELLLQVLPTPKVVDLAWDLKGGMLWSTSASTKVFSLLQNLFRSSFGMDLQPLAPLLLAARVSPKLSTEALMALDPLDLSLEGA